MVYLQSSYPSNHNTEGNTRMSNLNPLPYHLARKIVLGDACKPVVEGHPIADRICYPIEPADDLFLFGNTANVADDEIKLALLIRQTWHRILQADRVKIVAFWRTEGRHSPHKDIE
jgi:hypothetical protein